MGDRTRKAFLNISTGAAGVIVSTIVGIACRTVFIKYLNDEYLGLSALFMNLIAILSLAELGIGSAMNYALYKPFAEGDYGKVFGLAKLYKKVYIAIGISILVLSIVILPFVNMIVGESSFTINEVYTVYILFVVNTVSTYFFAYNSSILTADQRGYLVSGISTISLVLQSTIQIIMLIMGFGYYYYLIIQILSTLFYGFAIKFIYRRRYNTLKEQNVATLTRDDRSEIISNVKSIIVIKVSGMLVNSTDNFFINYFENVIITGYYSNYYLLITMLGTILMQLFTGVTASLGNLNAVAESNAKYEIFKKLHLVTSWLFSWFGLGFIFVANDVIKVWIGDNYILEQMILVAVGVNFLSGGFMNLIWTFKNTLGIFREGRYIIVVTAILNLSFSFLFGSWWGIQGILFATFFARLLTNLWYEPYLVFSIGFELKLWYYWKIMFKSLVVTILTSIVIAVIMPLVKLEPFMTVVVKIIICSFVSNLSFLIAYFRTEELKWMVGLLKRIGARMLPAQ